MTTTKTTQAPFTLLTSGPVFIEEDGITISVLDRRNVGRLYDHMNPWGNKTGDIEFVPGRYFRDLDSPECTHFTLAVEKWVRTPAIRAYRARAEERRTARFKKRLGA